MGQKLRSHATIMVPIPRGESPILFYPLEVDLGSLFLSIFVPKQWALVLLLSRDGICSLWWEISKQKDAISYFNLPKETESRDREKGQNLADLKRAFERKPQNYLAQKWFMVIAELKTGDYPVGHFGTTQHSPILSIHIHLRYLLTSIISLPQL